MTKGTEEFATETDDEHKCMAIKEATGVGWPGEKELKRERT